MKVTYLCYSHIFVCREAAQKAISSKEHCRVLSAMCTYQYLMRIFMIRYCQLNSTILSYIKAVISVRICHNLNHFCIICCLSPSLQYSQAFPQSFSQWMCMNAWIYRLLANMDTSELSAPANLITSGIRVLVRAQPQTQLRIFGSQNISLWLQKA